MPAGKGFVSLRDLQSVLSRVAPHLPHQTAALIFAQASATFLSGSDNVERALSLSWHAVCPQVDTDGDGRVGLRDWNSMMANRGHTSGGRVARPAPVPGADGIPTASIDARRLAERV